MEAYKNPQLSPDERARNLLSYMTLEEKIAQINIIRGSEFHIDSAKTDSCTVEEDDVFMQDKFTTWMGSQGIGYIHDIYSIPAIKNRLHIPYLI